MKIKLLCFLMCSSMVYAPYDPFVDDILNDTPTSRRSSNLAREREEQQERDVQKAKNFTEPKTPISRHSTDTSIGFSSRSNSTDSSIGYDSGDDGTKRSVSINFDQVNKDQNILEAFDDNFRSFNSDQDAVQAVTKYLDEGGDPNLTNVEGKSLMGLLLDNVSSGYKEYELKSNANIKAVLTLLLDKGATPTSAEIEQALSKYKNFVALKPDLKVDPKNFQTKSWGFANSFVARFLRTDAQKAEMQKDKQNASALADVVFMLDDAAPKDVVTLEQREKISNLEVQYKTTFQRVSSWWQRTAKSLFSKN